MNIIEDIKPIFTEDELKMFNSWDKAITTTVENIQNASDCMDIPSEVTLKTFFDVIKELDDKSKSLDEGNIRRVNPLAEAIVMFFTNRTNKLLSDLIDKRTSIKGLFSLCYNGPVIGWKVSSEIKSRRYSDNVQDIEHYPIEELKRIVEEIDEKGKLIGELVPEFVKNLLKARKIALKKITGNKG